MNMKRKRPDCDCQVLINRLVSCLLSPVCVISSKLLFVLILRTHTYLSYHDFELHTQVRMSWASLTSSDSISNLPFLFLTKADFQFYRRLTNEHVIVLNIIEVTWNWFGYIMKVIAWEVLGLIFVYWVKHLIKGSQELFYVGNIFVCCWKRACQIWVLHAHFCIFCLICIE